MGNEGDQGFGEYMRCICYTPLILTIACALHSKLSNDPTLSSLPLLSIFLKSFSLPYLGLNPPNATSKQVSASSEPGYLSEEVAAASANGKEGGDGDDLVEKDIRDRFRKMCEGYFDSVSKKLVIEHNVCRLLVFRSWVPC